ncbi:hypothetical protein BJ508DRAFT_325108 [Ascobolus immersus RN42]|uniref:Methyltransferase n=1 Tax=Ascobolus immersus RN42 TaxID=1160509 RepID=A0A3N4IFN1_ASCIM|nr:hypothetical protein BJ508DRAFT_325108 [Ascobolus immersus RN42]
MVSIHTDGPNTSVFPARFSYVDEKTEPRDEKPYQLVSDIGSSTFPKTNFGFRTYEEERVHNIRGCGCEHTFQLDEHGFCFRREPTLFTDWDSREQVELRHFPEVEAILKKHICGADHVEIFDWRRRGQAPNGVQVKGSRADMNNPLHALPPAHQSPMGALKRARMILGDRAPHMLQGRVRIINVWRPLFSQVESDPLAFCDTRSLKPDSLMETDLVRKSYTGATMFVRYRPGYKWFFMDRQTKDEISIFKSFDSDNIVQAPYCAHASFSMKKLRPYAKPRNSVEFRALVFTLPKNPVQ